VIGGINVFTAGMGSALSQGAKTALQGLKVLAAGSLNGARSIMSGQGVLGFLQILGGIASAVTPGLRNFMSSYSGPLKKVMFSLLDSLQQAPLLIYGGIQAIQNHDWFDAIRNILGAAVNIGQSFAGNFNTVATNFFDQVGQEQNPGITLSGGVNDWLSGLPQYLPEIMERIFEQFSNNYGEPKDGWGNTNGDYSWNPKILLTAFVGDDTLVGSSGSDTIILKRSVSYNLWDKIGNYAAFLGWENLPVWLRNLLT